MATPAARPSIPNNSFAISRSGERNAVLAALANDSAKPEGSDQSQIEAAKEFISVRIVALPPEFNGCHVIATGEQGIGRDVVSIQVFGTKLDL